MRHIIRRRGLTLIELLVVCAILVALLGLVAAVAPRLGDRQRASRGATMVQSWLKIARSRAVRSTADIHSRASGVRLLNPPPGPFYAQYVTELQYIETPTPFTGGTVDVPADNTRQFDRFRYVRLRGVELPTVGNAAVQPGDVIDLTVAGLYPPGELSAIRRIISVTPESTPNSYIIELDGEPEGNFIDYSNLATPPAGCRMTRKPTFTDFSVATPVPPVYPQAKSFADRGKSLQPESSNYIIYRQARPLPGEPTLLLPKGIGIDVSRDPSAAANANQAWHRTFPQLNTGGSEPFDILFDPSGRVVSSIGTSSSRLCLWVRDVSTNTTGPNVANDPMATDPTIMPPGDNTIICIYTRTGLVAAHPVDADRLFLNTSGNPNLWNPFAFTLDAQSSGQ